MIKKIVLLLLAFLPLFMSCKHEEGKGGLATIKGKVYAKDYNSNGGLVDEGYLGSVRVYISKHGDPNYFDDYDTSYDGSYQFDFLYEGTYDIWVFGDCDNCSWDQVYQLKTVEVNEKREVVVVEDLNITI
jgi:hypothetical protein